MKNLSQFKKSLVAGETRIKTIFHQNFVGRDEDNLPIYADLDKGVRTVSIVQTNSFAMETFRTDGTKVDSWCDFPKAKDCEFNNGIITIFQPDSRSSRIKEATNKMIPVLSYEIIS